MRHLLSLIAIPALAATPVVSHPPKDHLIPAKHVNARTAPTVRTIEYLPGEVVEVSNRLRYNTTIVLPEGEELADLVCGDSDDKHDGTWIINGARGTGFAYVKPTSAGAETNLTLVAKSGHSYLFMLHETRKSPPDLRVSLRIPVSPQSGPPVRMVPATVAEKAQQAAEDSRAELAGARAEYESDREAWQKKAAEAVAKAKADAPGSLRFDFKWKQKRGFHIEAIATDGEHTYLWGDPSAPAALYGEFQGKANLVHFSYSHGLYVADAVLESGWLQIGKERLKFKRYE